MSLSFEGRLQRRDVFRAYSLHSKPSTAGTIFRIGLLAISLAGIIVASAAMSDLQLALPALVMPILMLAAPWWLPRLQAGAQWKSYDELRGPMSGTASSDTIRVSGALASGEFSWDLFRQHKRASDMVLLYRGPHTLHIFPRTLFKCDEDWAAFSQLVAERVPQAAASSWRGPGKAWLALFGVLVLAVLAVALIINLLP